MRTRLASFFAYGLVLGGSTFFAACGGNDPGQLPDSGGGQDVITILPDAPTNPDAPPGTPDGSTVNPDAPPGTPDAAVPLPDAPPGACGSTNIVAGVTVSSSNTGAPNTSSGSCGGASAGEVVYYFDLASAADVIVTTDLPGTDFNTAVYVRTTCDDPATEEGCAGGNMLGDSLTLLDMAAGTYYIVVDGVAGASGNFDLLVTTRPIVAMGDPCDLTGTTNRCETGTTCIDGPTGPTCQGMVSACDAAAIVVSAPATVMGSTVGVSDTYAPGCSFDGAAGEIVYRVDVTGAYDLIATATPTNFAADMFDIILTAETTCGDGGTSVDCSDSPTASTPETVTVLDAAGTYYLVVDGYNSTAGEFSLDITLRPILSSGATCDPAGVDNRCAAGLDCLSDGAGGNTCQDPFAAVCSGATAATLGSPITGTIAAGSSNDLQPTCTFDAGTGEDIYSVDVTAGHYLIASETSLATSSLYLRGPDTCGPTADIDCDTGGTRAVTTQELTAGTYYVVVDGSGSYTLHVDLGNVLGAGATCDPFSVTDRCGADTWCFDAACASMTPVIDTAPNANFCDAQGPFDADFVVSGDITGGTDWDTYELTITATTDLVISTSDGLGCDVNTIVRVYDAAGMTCTMLDATPPAAIATDDNSGLEGICSNLTVTGLAAGTYYVRVQRATGATGTGNYFLTVDFQ